MLKNILMNQIHRYISDKKLSGYIDVDDSIDIYFLAQGEYNINFVIQSKDKKYVFRVNTKSQLCLDNQIEYEYNALKRLEASGVTPKAYFVDDTRDYFEYGVLIMEFLEGEHLNYKKDLGKAANIFSKIHSMHVNEYDVSNFIIEKSIFTERVLESKRWLKNFLASSKIDKNLKDFFMKYLHWAEKNSYKEKYFEEDPWYVINNTEVNSANFIINNEKHYLIDWEKPVISDPCQDITQFLAPTTTLWKTDYILSKDEKDKFFKDYIKQSKENKNIRDRVNMYSPYLYLRALSWCAYAYIEYLDPNKEIKNLDTFEKIKSYLDIDFMKRLLKEYNIK